MLVLARYFKLLRPYASGIGNSRSRGLSVGKRGRADAGYTWPDLPGAKHTGLTVCWCWRDILSCFAPTPAGLGILVRVGYLSASAAGRTRVTSGSSPSGAGHTDLTVYWCWRAILRCFAPTPAGLRSLWFLNPIEPAPTARSHADQASARFPTRPARLARRPATANLPARLPGCADNQQTRPA